MAPLVVNSRLEQLCAFRSRVRSCEVRLDDEFQHLIQDARSVLEIADREIAEALFVSRPTVNRWINGRNLPYLVVRKHAVDWLDEVLKSRIKRLNSDSQFSTGSDQHSSFSSIPGRVVANAR